MTDDITKLKKYRFATDEMPTRIAIQRLIDVLEEWRKDGFKTRRVNKKIHV